MTWARAWLAVLWLLMAMTASANAAPASTAPCHMDAAAMQGHKHPPMPADNGVMACCSQPMVISEPDTALAMLSVMRVHMSPLPAHLPKGTTAGAEPRPPKS